MRILGVDPGSNATGIGLIERNGSRVAWLHHGVLRPPVGAALPERLDYLHRELGVDFGGVNATGQGCLHKAAQRGRAHGCCTCRATGRLVTCNL